MKFILTGLLAILTFCNSALAVTGEPLDLQTRYGHFYSSIQVNEDGSSVGAYEWSKTVLKPAALEQFKRTSVSYDTRSQKAKITAVWHGRLSHSHSLIA